MHNNHLIHLILHILKYFIKYILIIIIDLIIYNYNNINIDICSNPEFGKITILYP